MMNCSPNLPVAQKAEFLSVFNVAMSDCGHSQSFRKVVTERAVMKYTAAWERKALTGAEVYRNKEEKKEALRISGGKPSKTDWFQRLGYQNTLMVPATLESKLTERVKEVMERSDKPGGFKTLILEDGGRSVKSDLVRSDPFPKSQCNRDGCLMCSNGPSNGKCWSSSVVYKVSCNRCVGQTHSYVGETSRSPYRRGCNIWLCITGRMTLPLCGDTLETTIMVLLVMTKEVMTIP